MKRTRDSQKGRVYAAEWSLPAMADLLESHEAIAAYVAHVLHSRFVRGKIQRAGWNPVTRITCEFSRSARKSVAYTRARRIVFGTRVSRMLVLHEVAHVLAPVAVHHGAPWVAIYLQLVRRFLGAEAQHQLRTAFLQRKVKTRVGTRRVLSDTERHRLAERMRALRAARALRPVATITSITIAA